MFRAFPARRETEALGPEDADRVGVGAQGPSSWTSAPTGRL